MTVKGTRNPSLRRCSSKSKGLLKGRPPASHSHHVEWTDPAAGLYGRRQRPAISGSQRAAFLRRVSVLWDDGEYVDFDPIMAWPKPVQKPYPPIIVGGGFPHAAKRAAEYGNGWIPIAGRGVDIVDMLPEYRQFMADAGRDGDPMGVSIFSIDPATVSEADIDHYQEAGVERMVIMLLSEEEDKILPLLDRVAGLIPAED